MPPETPIFAKVYEWSLWIMEKTAGFPKRFRHTLTERLEDGTLELEAFLLRANGFRGEARATLLTEADAALQSLKVNVRRSCDLQCMSERSYEHAAKLLNEVGRLLGGWIETTDSAGQKAQARSA